MFPSSREVVLDRPALGGSVLLFFPIISMPRPQQVLIRLFIIGGREGLQEKRMATHSSILVWRVPWTEEPGEL